MNGETIEKIEKNVEYLSNLTCGKIFETKPRNMKNKAKNLMNLIISKLEKFSSMKNVESVL